MSDSRNAQTQEDFLTQYNTLPSDTKMKFAERFAAYAVADDGYKKNNINGPDITFIFEFFGTAAGKNQHNKMNRVFDSLSIDDQSFKDKRKDFFGALAKEFNAEKIDSNNFEYSQSSMKDVYQSIANLRLMQEMAKQIDLFIEWEKNTYKNDSIAAMKEMTDLKRYLLGSAIFQLGNIISNTPEKAVEARFLLELGKSGINKPYNEFLRNLQHETKYEALKNNIINRCKGEVISEENQISELTADFQKYINQIQFYLLPQTIKISVLQELQNEATNALAEGVTNKKINAKQATGMQEALDKLFNVYSKRYQLVDSYPLKIAERMLNINDDVNNKQLSKQLPKKVDAQYVKSINDYNEFLGNIKTRISNLEQGSLKNKIITTAYALVGVERARLNDYSAILEYNDLFELYVDVKNRHIDGANSPISRLANNPEEKKYKIYFQQLEDALDGILQYKLGDEMLARVKNDINGLGIYAKNTTTLNANSSNSSNTTNTTVTMPTLNFDKLKFDDTALDAPRGDHNIITKKDIARSKTESTKEPTTIFSNDPITTIKSPSQLEKDNKKKATIPSLNLNILNENSSKNDEKNESPPRGPKPPGGTKN